MRAFARRGAVVRKVAPAQRSNGGIERVRAPLPGNQALVHGRTALSRSAASVPPVATAVQVAQKSPGRQIDPGARAPLERRFGHDFGDVRVHAGSDATHAAHAVGAKAYTAGNDIVFGTTERPESAGGGGMLVHELAHVVQQRVGGPRHEQLGTRHGRDEREAHQAASALGWGGLGHEYRSVARAVVPHSSTPPTAGSPALSSALAQVQCVELSYDDGPDTAGNTRRVLDALNAAGARATFYLVGKRIAHGDNWRIVFDIAASGQWIGNHAYDWNEVTDNHVFLTGPAQDRAQKILMTEWVIRDALIRGRDDARSRNVWDGIPAANRAYIEDVIARGTGRFRTPGLRSHTFHRGMSVTTDGATTQAALAMANDVLAATGLRPLRRTFAGALGEEGVDIDPEDWRPGRTQQDIQSGVTDALGKESDSILLHSRVAATAAATPGVVADIQGRNWRFDPTAQGALGSFSPRPGFANLATISKPPTSSEIAAARTFLRTQMISIGPVLSANVAIGILQLAQRAGPAEVNAFIAEIRSTTIPTLDGPIPMANWLNVSETWQLFAGFFENWMTNAPFPRIKGVTL